MLNCNLIFFRSFLCQASNGPHPSTAKRSDHRSQQVHRCLACLGQGRRQLSWGQSSPVHAAAHKGSKVLDLCEGCCPRSPIRGASHDHAGKDSKPSWGPEVCLEASTVPSSPSFSTIRNLQSSGLKHLVKPTSSAKTKRKAFWVLLRKARLLPYSVLGQARLKFGA